MDKWKQKHLRKYAFIGFLCFLLVFSLFWFYLTPPEKLSFHLTEHISHLIAVFFLTFFYLKMGRVTPSPTFTLGFYLVIFGFWNLFLERLTPSRSIRFLNAPFYLLLFNIGAVTFFVSLYSSLTRELSYTRNLLSFILQHIPDHIYIKDRQSRFVNASLSSVKHLGLQRVEELIGKTDFDFFTPTRAQEFFEEEQRIIQSGTTTVSREEKEIQLDGRETWVSTTKIPWTNERGEIIGLIGISRDITSTVQQRFELEKRERFLSAIFEGVQDGLCVLDTEMNIVRANHFIEEMYPEERPLSGKKCFRAFHGQEHPCQSCPTILVFQTGQRQVKTMPYVRQGQQIGWLEVISYPLKDEKGNIYGVIEQVRNVTERMRYEEDLKTSEQNFRLFAEANPSAIIIYQDNRYVYVNSAAEKLTGYSREELTGMPVLRIIHPDFHALVQERVAKRQQNIPVDKQYEVKIITKDGRERWLFLSAETISYQGKWAGIVSASDVTEKKIQEMKTMHLKLVLEGIRNVGQTMIREEDPSVILEKVCYELVQNGAYTSVLLIPDFEENHRPFFAGMSEETAQKWISLLKEKELLLPEKIFTLTHSDLFPSSQGLFATLIAYGEQQMGTMAVTLPLEFINDPEEQNLFLELSRDLAFGLHTTELKKLKNEAQKNLEESERRFRNLIENLPLGVTTFQNGQFRYANPFASYVTDHFATSLRSFVEEKLSSRQAFSEAISFTIDDEVLLRGEDGEERWFFIRGRSIQYENQQSLLLFILDITEKKKNEAVVEYLATHDTLTGLCNRGFFETVMSKADREENLPISVIMGDLNGLKLVNDAFGHEEGDRLLLQAASFLRESCPPESTIARFGGDEFVILLPRTDHKKAQEIMEHIYTRFSTQTTKPIPVSISLGFGTKTNPSQNIYDTVRIAENWMYQRKLTDGMSFRIQTLRFLQKTLHEIAYEVEEHSQRIKKWALQMAQILNIPEHEKEMLPLLADFHDVGKITIPQEILRKPGPLSEEEWKIVRRHPEVGFRITQAIPALASIANLVLAHHEWYNGKGYPRGLKGEEIPLLARLIAICDAFDVMISGRPYKRALAFEEAVTELRRYSGTQFDPALVTTFIEILGKKA